MNRITRRTVSHAMLATLWLGRPWSLGTPALAAARHAPGFGNHDLYALVGKSTRLSVLVGRVARSQAQRALEVLPAPAVTQLAQSTQEAQRGLAELNAALANSPAQAEMQALAQTYGVFLKANEGLNPKDHAALLRMARLAGPAVEAADLLTQLLVKHLGHPMARILGTTADMQRLSQHLAARFMMMRTGVSAQDKQEQSVAVAQGRELFARNLDALRAAPLQTPAIQQRLLLLANQWLLMNESLGRTAQDVATMEHVCTTCERILEVLTQLMPEYEAALRQLLG